MHNAFIQIAKYLAYMLTIIVAIVCIQNTLSSVFKLDGYTEIVLTASVVFLVTFICTCCAKKLNVFPS